MVYYGPHDNAFFMGSISFMQGHMNEKNCLNNLTDQLTFFPNGDGVLQDNKAHVHIDNVLQDRFSEHEDEFQILSSYLKQYTSILLNFRSGSKGMTSSPKMWFTLEKKVRGVYPPSSSVCELATVLE